MKIEEIKKEIEDIGRTVRCIVCGGQIYSENIKMYPHEGGWDVNGKGKQWIYVHCANCGHDSTLGNLRILKENQERKK